MVGTTNGRVPPSQTPPVASLPTTFPIASTVLAGLLVRASVIIAAPILESSTPLVSADDAIVLDMRDVQVVGSEDHLGFGATALSLALSIYGDNSLISRLFTPETEGKISVRFEGGVGEGRTYCSEQSEGMSAVEGDEYFFRVRARQEFSFTCTIESAGMYIATLGERAIAIPAVEVISDAEPGCLIIELPQEFSDFRRERSRTRMTGRDRAGTLARRVTATLSPGPSMASRTRWRHGPNALKYSAVLGGAESSWGLAPLPLAPPVAHLDSIRPGRERQIAAR